MGRRLACPCQGYESLTLAFCLATKRCMNLDPDVLRVGTSAYRNIGDHFADCLLPLVLVPLFCRCSQTAVRVASK